MTVRHIWIVEIMERGKWMPTVGAGLTKRDAEREMHNEWQGRNADDKFRVRKYVRQEK